MPIGLALPSPLKHAVEFRNFARQEHRDPPRRGHLLQASRSFPSVAFRAVPPCIGAASHLRLGRCTSPACWVCLVDPDGKWISVDVSDERCIVEANRRAQSSPMSPCEDRCDLCGCLDELAGAQPAAGSVHSQMGVSPDEGHLSLVVHRCLLPSTQVGQATDLSSLAGSMRGYGVATEDLGREFAGLSARMA